MCVTLSNLKYLLSRMIILQINISLICGEKSFEIRLPLYCLILIVQIPKSIRMHLLGIIIYMKRKVSVSFIRHE